MMFPQIQLDTIKYFKRRSGIYITINRSLIIFNPWFRPSANMRCVSVMTVA